MLLQPAEKPSQIGPNARWRPKHVRKYARTVVPTPKVSVRLRSLLVRKAIDWILPWGFRDYPGKQRGMSELLGGRPVETVKVWLKGHRRLPAWACLALAEHIEARCRVGLALVAELRAEASKAKPRRGGQGFTRVDPVTGLDGRSKTGRRNVKEL